MCYCSCSPACFSCAAAVHASLGLPPGSLPKVRAGWEVLASAVLRLLWHNSLALCPACSCVSGCLSIPGAAAAWACQPRAVADSSTVSCCHLGPAKQPALVHLRSLCFVLLTAASERQQVAVSCCTDPLHLRISCHDAPLLRTFCLCR